MNVKALRDQLDTLIASDAGKCEVYAVDGCGGSSVVSGVMSLSTMAGRCCEYGPLLEVENGVLVLILYTGN